MEGESDEHRSSEEEDLDLPKCHECDRGLCPHGRDCVDHIFLCCDFCHEGEHHDGFAAESLARIEEAIEKNQSKDQVPVWELSEILAAKIRWIVKFDVGDQGQIWNLLDSRFRLEQSRPNPVRRAEKLGKINSMKIKWIRRNESQSSPKIFDLLEEIHDLALEVDDYKTQAMSLRQMVNWITMHEPDRIEDAMKYWEMQLAADKAMHTSGKSDSNINEKITLRKMIQWMTEFYTKDHNLVYKLFIRYWNLLDEDDIISKSMGLRIASYAPAKKNWKSGLRSFIEHRIDEMVRVTSDPMVILQLTITLRNIGSNMPDSAIRRIETEDIFDSFLLDLIRVHAGIDVEAVSSEFVATEGDTGIEFLKHQDFPRAQIIQIKDSVPNIEARKIDPSMLVLDFPNIFRCRVEDDVSIDHHEDLLEQVCDNLESQGYSLGDCWIYLSYGMISEYTSLVRKMFHDDRFNILMSVLDPGISEDWSFLSFCQIKGYKVVSNDKFITESANSAEVTDFILKARIPYIWDFESGSIDIGWGRLFWKGDSEEVRRNNSCTATVTNYYGANSEHIADQGVSVAMASNHLQVTIKCKNKIGRGYLIGTKGWRVGGLQRLLMERLDTLDPGVVKISIQIEEPSH